MKTSSHARTDSKPAILVPDSQAKALIAVVRSLGRAGYQVHAVSAQSDALGLKSSYACYSAVHPPYDSDAFVTWLRNYIKEHDIRMITPTAGMLFAVRSHFDEFKPLLPVTHDADRLYRCFDKTEVVKLFQAAPPESGLMANHPRSAIIDLDNPLREALLPKSSTGFYVKAEARRTKDAVPEDRSPEGFAFTSTPEEALVALHTMAPHWKKALVQEACSGVQVCVSVLMDKGRALAVSSVQDCHPLPHSRGTMSLRQSASFPDIEADTIRRLAYLGWQGCAMGEYRLDTRTNEFNLIEINFRFWQYLHLDLWANMDYPLMQAEWFLNGTDQFHAQPKTGVICRDTWPGEVAQVLNELRRSDLTFAGKMGAVTRFLGRFLDPRIHSDLSFPGDRKLYWRGFLAYLRLEASQLQEKLKRLA